MPQNYDELKDILNDLNPLESGGHVNVIKGVEWSENASDFIFYIYDPWCGGTEETFTYSQLLFNASLDLNNQLCVDFWFPTTVTKTDYSQNTILLGAFTCDFAS